MGMPMASPGCRSLSAGWLKSLLMLAVPVISVVKPWRPSASRTTACTLPMLSSASSTPPAMMSGMMAVWPSFEIGGVTARGSYGVDDVGAERRDRLCRPSVKARNAGSVALRTWSAR